MGVVQSFRFRISCWHRSQSCNMGLAAATNIPLGHWTGAQPLGAPVGCQALPGGCSACAACSNWWQANTGPPRVLPFCCRCRSRSVCHRHTCAASGCSTVRGSAAAHAATTSCKGPAAADGTHRARLMQGPASGQASGKAVHAPAGEQREQGPTSISPVLGNERLSSLACIPAVCGIRMQRTAAWRDRLAATDCGGMLAGCTPAAVATAVGRPPPPASSGGVQCFDPQPAPHLVQCPATCSGSPRFPAARPTHTTPAVGRREGGKEGTSSEHALSPRRTHACMVVTAQ